MGITFDIAAVQVASILLDLLSMVDLHVRYCVSHGPGVQILLDSGVSLFLFIDLFLSFHAILIVLLTKGSVVKLLSQIHGRIHRAIALVHDSVLRPEFLGSDVHPLVNSFR